MAEGFLPEEKIRAAAKLGDSPIDIAAVALAFAALDHPRAPLEHYIKSIAMIAEAVDARVNVLGGRPLSENLAASLGRAIAGDLGYKGDAATYDDLQNANLIRVIDRRKGLPVTLGILYIHAARAQGWRAEGLNFPNHFLIRVWIHGRAAVLDPFNNGRLIQAEALHDLVQQITRGQSDLSPGATQAVTDRHVVLRLQNNIKLRLLQNEKFDGALKVLARMLLLAPDHKQLVQEAGVVNARLGNLRAAVSLLRDYLGSDAGSPTDRHETARLLQSLELRLN